MKDPDTPMRTINPDRPLDAEGRARVAALARRQRKASSLLMKVISYAGGQVESGLKSLPAPMRARVEGAATSALTASYELAAESRGTGRFAALTANVKTDTAHKVLATISGALGGVGGLPTALAELPIATTVIFRAVQGVAESYGEDPLSEETRLECLRVFGAGSSDPSDDGIDTSFIGARLGLTGAALHKLIAKVAPRFATVLGQKLASQSVPILGAAAGAGTNYAFIDYYVQVAHVHFGLRQIQREYDDAAVLEVFHAELAKAQVPYKG